MARVKISGAIIYVQEELSDARLRCDEIKNHVSEVFNLIEKSGKRDEIYALAGHIIHSLPESLLKLERALEASAMAVNKIDYEDIRQTLRPEKVDELERVLDDVRIKIPRRTGKPIRRGDSK